MENNTLVGGALTGTAVTSGSMSWLGWIAENIALISLSVTFVSMIGGLIFMYLGWRESKRRNDLFEQQLNSQ